MKKILLLAAIFCVTGAGLAAAEVDGDFSAPDVKKPSRNAEELVSDHYSLLKAKVNELERRLNDMERDRRFDQDRLRQLDRDVSELKRRF